jgi:hypothetical protein
MIARRDPASGPSDRSLLSIGTIMLRSINVILLTEG